MTGSIEVRTRQVPAMPVVTETAVLDQAGLEAWLPGAMGRVVARAEAEGGWLTARELPFLERTTDDPVILTIYEGDPHLGPCEIVCAVAVPSGGDRTIPPHREAYARVTKELVTGGRLGDAYDAAERAAGTATGPPRELYWTDFGDAAPGDEVFDVAWPTD